MALKINPFAAKGFSQPKFINASVEAMIQGALLGKTGFGNPIPALFRVADVLKGEDPLDLRAYNLLYEAISIALIEAVSTSSYTKPLAREDIEKVSKNLFGIVDRLLSNGGFELTESHLIYPGSIKTIKELKPLIYVELLPLSPAEEQDSFIARFSLLFDASIHKVRLRKPKYYSLLFDSTEGISQKADSFARSWRLYRAELIKRYEATPIFGESIGSGVTVSQVYVPLRVWWSVDNEDESNFQKADGIAGPHENLRKNIAFVDDAETKLIKWLDLHDREDSIRLISGGPGSGKSTLARRLAATFAAKPEWRTLLVPLQRISASGNLQNRINEYFTLYDEPFEDGAPPIQGVGKDGIENWLVIFDGLDEIAKEGADSEKAAQEFASSLIDWAAQIEHRLKIRFVVLGRAPSMQEASQRLALAG